jgi:hypothetical protein
MFDARELEELLTLRTLTLNDGQKREPPTAACRSLPASSSR